MSERLKEIILQNLPKAREEVEIKSELLELKNLKCPEC
jgi:hypothetical protein